jgi:L-alanine-DL-glutamate epimerase-like enolase superfamily enzyme
VLSLESFVMRQAVDFLQPDVARAGGITEIRKIAALAAVQHVPISFHTWGDAVALAASIHLSAAIPECTVMELDYTYNPLRAELLREPLKVENGFMAPPDKPGLGIELDAGALGRFAYSGVEEIAVRQKTLAAQIREP